MKTHPFATLSAGITALLITPVFAIEAPVDNAPPPEVNVEAGTLVVEAPAEIQDAKPEKNAEIAFLGVGTTEIPEILAEHLDIKPGEGVLVNSLQPDSPATKAGITLNDIITRIDGKPVESTIDLGEKVRSHKPGDSIHLDIIHKGKTNGLELKLASRPDFPEAMQNLQGLDALPLDGAPKEIQDRLRDIKKRLGVMELQLGGLGGAGINPGVPGMQGMGRIRIHNGASFRMRNSDGTGSVELKSNDDGKEVTVRDNEDKVTWAGPWDTEQDKAAAPAEIRQRIERLNIDP